MRVTFSTGAFFLFKTWGEALSGFTTPNGPLFACLAMGISFLLCWVVSLLARAWKLPGGEGNTTCLR